MRYDLAVFDFDGTLVDTREAIVRSLRAVLAENGFPVPREDAIWRLVGRGLRLVLGELTGRPPEGEEIGRLAEVYKARFDEVAPGNTRLIDGVAEALAFFGRTGVRLAIATNRARPSLEMILAEHRLLDRFGLLVTASCVKNPKPAPDMLESVLRHFGADRRKTLMIGDTTVDVLMGRAAGVDTCAVTYGAQPGDVLRRESPTHLVDHAAHLPTLWKPSTES